METIELVNDGTGLGFGIVGGKTTGVIVKTILPGGIADKVKVKHTVLMPLTVTVTVLNLSTDSFSYRTVACAVGITSCVSGTLTCTVWAVSRSLRCCGSVETESNCSSQEQQWKTPPLRP